MSRTPNPTGRGILAATLALGIAGLAGLGLGAVGREYAHFDDQGRLVRPEGYREWIFVGAPLTPNDMNAGQAAFPEFHNVYLDPESWEYWGRTGELRDGAILVKELVSVGSKQAASGNGYFAGEFIGLEATVKSRERFPDEPGNWAYFRFTNEGGMAGSKLLERSEAMPTATCNGCHAASAETDWVFTQYYPVMGAARP